MTKILNLPATHKAGEHKKTLEYAGLALLVIVVFLGIMFLGSGNSGKNSTPAVIPVINDTDNDSGTSEPDNPNDSGEVTPVAETDESFCPEGQVMNMEKGECEPEGKVPDEVGPIGEPIGYEGVKGYGEYVSTLHEYEEQNNNKNAYREWDDTFGFVDGHPLYLRVNSIEKDKKLDFSVGYIDDAKKWHEVKRFISEKERIKEKDMGYYSYGGCFSYPNDPLYPDKACTYHHLSSYGFTVVENTHHGFGIIGTHCFYQGTLHYKDKDKIQSFRSGVSYDPGPSISSLSN